MKIKNTKAERRCAEDPHSTNPEHIPHRWKTVFFETYGWIF